MSRKAGAPPLAGGGDRAPASLPAGCRSVVVVGLGVMGGSVAKALRRRAPETPVYGIDPDEDARALAAGDGVRLADGLAECAMPGTVVVFAAPLDATEAMVESEAPLWSRAALVTDMASLKVPVAAAARRGAERAGEGAKPGRNGAVDRVFVGAHPMCGSEQSGYAASRAELFDGAPVWLCSGASVPHASTSPARASAGLPDVPSEPGARSALDSAAAFWRLLGADPRPISAEAHDRTMSWVSHLPQLAAWALAGTLEDAGFAPSDLGPGGAEATRLAGSGPEVWGPLLNAAAKEDAAALAALEARVAGLRRMLEAGDRKALRDAILAGRRWRTER